MGEEVDFSKFAESEPQAAKPAQVKLDETVIAEIAELLSNGRSRQGLVKLLHDQGRTYEESDKIVTLAEQRIGPAAPKKIDLPKMIAVTAICLVLVGIVAFVLSQSSFTLKDCGEDTLCAGKILACTQGQYSSDYRGFTNSYDIRQVNGYCQVFVKVTGSSIAAIPAGSTMTCTYPFDGTQSSIEQGYTQCAGDLALLLGGF